MMLINIADLEFMHDKDATPSWMRVNGADGAEIARVDVLHARWEPTEEATLHLTITLPDAQRMKLFLALSESLKNRRG